jgi:hypothetical protein
MRNLDNDYPSISQTPKVQNLKIAWKLLDCSEFDFPVHIEYDMIISSSLRIMFPQCGTLTL